MDSRKPLTAGERQEIGVLLYRAGFEIANGGTVDETDVADMHRTCRRLLSLLTPPSDAAVKEAVESLQRMVDMDTFVEATAVKMQALLSYVRAVQAPRLTTEQVDYLRQMDAYFEHTGTDGFRNGLRLYWPEAFAGDGGK